MLNIDRDDAIARFDELFTLVNGRGKKAQLPRPVNHILDVAVFMDLNAAQASFLVEKYSIYELFDACEIRNSKFILRKEYKHLAIKGAERRQAASAWKKWFKEKTSPPKDEKVKKSRAPRKRKGVGQ